MRSWQKRLKSNKIHLLFQKSNMKKRFEAIDFLRGVGILGVIATHVFSDNLINPLNTFIWNYLHFVITSFIFCSGYVMYIAYKDKVDNLKKLPSWYKKRLIRLLEPYYLYLIAHVGLVFILPLYFGGLGIQKNWHYIRQSIILTGGINENWLPLLFIELAVLFPLLLFALKKFKPLIWIYVSLAVVYTCYITLFPAPYSIYRWVMWIPWSLVFVLSWYFAKRDQEKASTKIYLGISVVSAVVFTVLFLWFKDIHRSVTLIDNKYPPNLFYISYEFAVSFILLFIAKWHVLQQEWLVRMYTWLSSRSYGLFFVHFLYLDLILQLNKLYNLNLNVWIELIFVTGISIVSILLWEKVKVLTKK